MKRILCALVLMTGPAISGEITVKVSDSDQQAFSNLPGAVDQCVSGLQLRGDAQMCKLISTFLTEFSARVKAAVPTAHVNAVEPATGPVGSMEGKTGDIGKNPTK